MVWGLPTCIILVLSYLHSILEIANQALLAGNFTLRLADHSRLGGTGHQRGDALGGADAQKREIRSFQAMRGNDVELKREVPCSCPSCWRTPNP